MVRALYYYCINNLISLKYRVEIKVAYLWGHDETESGTTCYESIFTFISSRLIRDSFFVHENLKRKPCFLFGKG